MSGEKDGSLEDRISTLEKLLPGATVFRAMPNINVLVGMSATAVAPRGRKGWEEIDGVLRCFGRVYWVPEEYLDAWTALAGSGPAFIAEIVDAMVLGAVAAGMPRNLAYQAILDVLEGTAKLLRENIDRDPAVMRDMVTTPCGHSRKGADGDGVPRGQISPYVHRRGGVQGVQGDRDEDYAEPREPSTQ